MGLSYIAIHHETRAALNKNYEPLHNKLHHNSLAFFKRPIVCACHNIPTTAALCMFSTIKHEIKVDKDGHFGLQLYTQKKKKSIARLNFQ